MPGSQPVAWRGVRYGTTVVSADGEPVGTVREVLGSDAEDIFHGIRVRMQGRDVVLTAERIAAMTAASIQADLSAAEIEALPDATDEATYHLASVGWLRRHLGWREDSKGDEEPG